MTWPTKLKPPTKPYSISVFDKTGTLHTFTGDSKEEAQAKYQTYLNSHNPTPPPFNICEHADYDSNERRY